MDELVEEFQRLINEVHGDALAGSIELLLQQMEPDSAKALRLCAIPHQFNPNILQILVPSLKTGQAEKEYYEFSKLSIITTRQDNLAMHDEARRYLFSQWLRSPNYPEFAAASARLVRYFSPDFQIPDELRESIERRRMFHLLGAEQAAGFVEFERLFSKMRHHFRFNECEILVNLVHEYDSVLAPENAVLLTYHEGELAVDLRQWVRAEQLFGGILDDGAVQPELCAKVYNRLGNIHAERRDWQKAIDFNQKALQLANISGSSQDTIYCILHDLGAAYRDKGDFTQASRLLENSIKLAEENHDISAMALGYNSLGTLYYKLGDTYQGIEAYERSLDCLRRSEERFRPAQILNNLGMAYARLNDWEKSKQFFQQSLDIKRQAGDTLGQATTLNNLVQVYQNLNLYQQAIETLQQAIDLFREINDLHNMAVAKRNLGKLYRRIRNPDLSRQALTEAIELFKCCNENKEADATREELDISTRKDDLPWWAWIAIILMSLVLFVFLIVIVQLLITHV